MKSFLITYLFYNEEGIPIQSSLPVLAKDESDARNYLHLDALKLYQFKEMDNDTFGGYIGAIIGIIAIAVFPKLVAEGYIVGKLSPASCYTLCKSL